MLINQTFDGRDNKQRQMSNAGLASGLEGGQRRKWTVNDKQLNQANTNTGRNTANLHGGVPLYQQH